MDTTNYTNIVSIISSILGVLSALVTVFSFFLNYIKQQKTLEEIDNKLFKQALESGDIKKLGSYLDKNIGNVTIKEFSTNSKIQKKVNNYIQNIISFIGTEEDIKKADTKLHKQEIIHDNDNIKVPNEFYPFIKELQLGQPWNALAQLRRHIEINLREILKSYNIETKEFISISQMLSILDSMNLIPTSYIQDLKYAVAICNKAVHGIDISLPEAEEAIQVTIRAFNEINKDK
ncbi:hypothetical protein ASF10_19260 [Flavobacterium sp. Leaf82]|uniref:hypothetical protein n=1 Tax=Flavobacterium sp. Leaf82 TaxID=1736238 RepID=UPI0006F6CFBD|nr:hypothetical protein [Flavobacterium sp. Leaf82]KQO33214.1 hypothetical protein ASF10_19260 [Flavobacterium sp. Leaf82]